MPEVRGWSRRGWTAGGGGGGGGNGLLNNLVAYLAGNEESGNALDLHTNALHLTDVNTVTSNPGWPGVYANSRQYTAANNEYHTRPGDDALLSTGDVDFTVAACFRTDNVNVGAGQPIFGKFDVANQREYLLFYNRNDHAPNQRFTFLVSSNGVATQRIDANTFGAAANNTWYLVIGWHDALNDLIGISVNDVPDTLAYALGVFDSTARATIGAIFNGGAPLATYYMDGRIGPTMFWKSAGGAGGVLTAAQRTQLWNGGTPLKYTRFTV